MATAEELRCRIARIRAASERLDGVDYFGRNWIAEYAGDVDCVTDCLEEVLNQGVALSLTPFATEVADLLACQGHIPMGGC
jgi:hypothetical protein